MLKKYYIFFHFTTFLAIVTEHLGVNHHFKAKFVVLKSNFTKMLKKYYIVGYFNFNFWYNSSKFIVFDPF